MEAVIETVRLGAAIETVRLGAALAMVAKVASVKTTLPILSNVVLRAKVDLVEIEATNLEVGLRVRVAADVREPGDVCLSPKDLAAFVGKGAAKDVRLKSSKEGVRLESGKRSLSVPSEDPLDFPPLPEVKGISFPASGFPLIEAIRKVSLVAAAEDTRPVLHAVYFDVDAGELLLATADGFRLRTVKTSVPWATPTLVSLDVVWVLLRIAGSKQRIQSIVVGEGEKGSVAFEGDGWSLVSSKAQGTFPNFRVLDGYERLWGQGTGARVEAKALREAIDFLKNAVQDPQRRASLVLQEGKVLVGAADGGGAGRRESFEELPAEVQIVGGQDRVALDQNYIASFLDGETGQVEMILGPNGRGNAVAWRGATCRDLIMPLFVADEYWPSAMRPVGAQKPTEAQP